MVVVVVAVEVEVVYDDLLSTSLMKQPRLLCLLLAWKLLRLLLLLPIGALVAHGIVMHASQASRGCSGALLAIVDSGQA